MTTTIDIAGLLLEQAKRVAARAGTTVKALVEQGLEWVLSEQLAVRGFRLRNASFGGEGSQPGVQGLSWDRVREFAYEGRGG